MNRSGLLSLLLIFIFGCENHPSVDHDTAKANAVTATFKGYIRLGGLEQYTETFGDSSSLPVLLFIHGGPGWPQTPMLRHLNGGLSHYFIVATWDQRGCGLSSMKDSMPKDMSLAAILQDAHEYTAFLKKKFHQQKIWLCGFSWGSIVGMELARKYPEDYMAYISTSQVVNVRAGMKATQDWLRQQAILRKDKHTIVLLDRLASGDTSLCKGDLPCFMKQYELIAPYNGAVFDSSTPAAVTNAMVANADYKAYNWEKGFNFSAQALAPDMFAADYRKLDTFPIPIFFLSGRHDWNVPQALTEQVFKRVKAPYKEQIWFEKSGHGPLEEEPIEFNNVMASLPSRLH